MHVEAHYISLYCKRAHTVYTFFCKCVCFNITDIGTHDYRYSARDMLFKTHCLHGTTNNGIPVSQSVSFDARKCRKYLVSKNQ
jgi:hypothetical protein